MPAKKRHFTLSHPIHIDGFGAIVRIIASNATSVVRGIAFPLIGLRYDKEGHVEVESYTADGSFSTEGRPSHLDLHDADLASIKPLVAADDPDIDPDMPF